jgi:hypothetical protein
VQEQEQEQEQEVVVVVRHHQEALVERQVDWGRARPLVVLVSQTAHQLPQAVEAEAPVGWVMGLLRW